MSAWRPASRLQACKRSPSPRPSRRDFSGRASRRRARAPPAAAAPADDGNWTMPGKDYAVDALQRRSTRSPPANVGKLQVAFTFSTGTTAGLRGAAAGRRRHDVHRHAVPELPLRARPHQARRAGEMDVQAQARSRRRRASPAATRSTAAPSTDDGQDLLQHARRPHHRGRRRTAASRSGAPSSATSRRARPSPWRRWSPRAKCWSAIRAARWACAAGSPRSTQAAASSPGRPISTGPDKDVLIGPDFKPFYAMRPGQGPRRQELAAATPGRSAAAPSGAGSATIRELKLIYYGTGNPGPVEPRAAAGRQQMDRRHLRPRRRHRRRRAGSTRSTPHDLFDHDDINEIILLDMPVATGSRARCSLRPGAQRLSSTCMDRATGQVLSADPYGYINAYNGVDLKTGRLIAEPGEGAASRAGSCATSARPRPGAKDWNPSAFSPRHRPRLHPAHQPLHGLWARWRPTTSPARPIVGADVKMYAGPGGNRGVFTAWDPVDRRKAVGDQGGPAAVEPGARDRRRTRLLRNAWTAGSRRSTRAPASCCGSSRPAAGSSASRSATAVPTAGNISRSSSGVGGWAGAIVVGRPRPARPDRRARLRQCGQGPAEKTTAGGMLYVFALPR